MSEIQSSVHELKPQVMVPMLADSFGMKEVCRVGDTGHAMPQ